MGQNGSYRGLDLHFAPATGDFPLPDGELVGLVIGMSITTSLMDVYAADIAAGTYTPRITWIDGAQPGRPLDNWTDPTKEGITWDLAEAAVIAAGKTMSDIQVIWCMNYAIATGLEVWYPDPDSTFYNQQTQLDLLDPIIKTKCPNAEAVWLTAGTPGHWSSHPDFREPSQYETNHGQNKWLSDGPPAGLWYGWGPYLWGEIEGPGSGQVWERDDLNSAGIHFSTAGKNKQSAIVGAFFDAI